MGLREHRKRGIGMGECGELFRVLLQRRETTGVLAFRRSGIKGFFFSLSFKNIFSSFFFLTGDRTACFNAAGNDPIAVTKVMMPQEREGLLLE